MSKRLFILTSCVLVLSLVCNAGAQGTGTIMYEIWSDIGGTNMEDLTGNANFPDNPTSGELVTLFETPTDIADNFGGRIYGWLHPATSGDYTFWIATDDDGDLLLSTDDDPANAVVICGVDGWAPARAFDGEAGSPGTRQMSAPIALEGGQKYYIEGRYKEGGGGDNLAVAWQGPDSPERSVIDGSFLSPAPWNIVLKRAKNPNPADGAIDADTTSLEWAAGPSSVSYKVYLSTDSTIEESELVAETDLTIHLTALDMGAAYWWRVDAIEADGTLIEGAVWSFTTLPLEAHFPNPADGAKSQAVDAKLSWTAGKGTIMHDVYFGMDEALVAAGDPSTFKGKVMVTSYDPGPLELETTYYWKIDEFSVTGTNVGPVWSFTTIGAVEITDPDLLLYYDFETGEGSVAIDQSGHSNHGLFMGTPEWSIGVFGGGLKIERDEVDYLQTEGSLGITSNNITVAGWVKHDASPQPWSGILTTRGSGNLGLQHNGEELRYMWGADEYWWVETGLQIPNGEWYFAALTIAPDQGKLYLNGIEQTLVNVAEHVPVTFDSQIRVARDHNDDRIMTCLIDEVRLYNKTLTDVEILKLMQTSSDVTAPGDVVQGIPTGLPCGGNPSENYSPCGELPPLVIDDNVNTKYLNFGGNFEAGEAPSGFQVTPSSGPSIVTGLTFTTANDEPPRDPIAFALYGSNESIDGPYELIASGDIVDFAQAVAWPRFTMNATPIMFDNAVAYKHYQVLFTALRDEASANSMQIAEVELLGIPAPVAHWTFDEGSGIVAADSSGNGSDGVLVGDPQWVEGKIGGALEFDGDGDYVDCGNPAVLDITGDITIMCWIKVAAFSKTWETIIAKGDDSYRMSRGPGDGDSIHFGANGTGDNLNASTVVTTDTWRHVALVYNGTDKIIYIDGDEDARLASSGNINHSNYNLFIGENSQAVNRHLTGLVDDVKIYNLALSQAEVRAAMKGLKAGGANIILVTRNTDENADGIPDDQGLVDWLEAEGHSVDVQRDYWMELDDAKIAALNAADLIIVSRGCSSGDYNQEGEPTQWNSIETPMILLNAYLVRTTGWFWLDSASAIQLDFPIMEAVLPGHPIFEGVAVDADNIVLAIDGAVGSGQTTFVTADNVGNGTLIAQSIDGVPWIVEWEAGVEFFDGAGQVPAGKRLLLAAGTQEPPTWGELNLTEDGLQILRNAINIMLAPFVVKINFQQVGGEVPEGYLPDGGEVFGDRGNGYSYGWNKDIQGDSRNRGSGNAIDERYDTLNHLQKGDDAIWEIELPNGTYDIYMVCGDPDNTDQINNFDVEGVVVEDPDGEDNFDEYTLTVEVADGLLTIKPAPGSSNCKIMFVDIAKAVPAVNLLVNGGFEDGVMAPWSTYGSLVTTAEVVQTLDGAAVPEDPIEGSSCLHVMVADAGANFWDAGLQHAGHVFEAGKAYTLSVYMKSKSGTLDINIKPERGASPWEGYGDQIVTITEEWAQYSVTTPVIEADVDPASITFHIAFTTGDFWVDGASWTEVE